MGILHQRQYREKAGPPPLGVAFITLNELLHHPIVTCTFFSFSWKILTFPIPALRLTTHQPLTCQELNIAHKPQLVPPLFLLWK